ncbi:MAG: chemotaxis protein CheA [Desulfobulbaceae bacterium]|nr:chemotaxis protein CheA [Desulfobulbaceae bacterium]
MEFINEVRDLLDDLEPEILSLSKLCEDGVSQTADENVQTLHGIFRLFHSLKGGAGFLEFDSIVHSAHSAENLLDRLRTGDIQIIPSHVDLLCAAVDFTKEALDYVEENFDDHGMAEKSEKLIKKIERALAGEPVEMEAQPAESAITLDLDLSPEQLVTPETVHHFMQEADELVQEVEADLLQWVKSQDDSDLLAKIFRSIHSFKGNCGFLGYKDLELLSHGMETVLDAVRSGGELDREKVAETILSLIDVLKTTLAAIMDGGKGKIESLALYLELLTDLMPKEQQRDITHHRPARLGDILVEKGVVTEDDLDKALEEQQKPLGQILVEKGVTTDQEVHEALAVQKKSRSAPPQAVPPLQSKAPVVARARQDIRVDLDKLDSLINLIGEMVIAENMLIHSPDLKGLELDNFHKAGQHMGKIVRELQEMAMVIRMIPVSGLFRRMTRLVHDLAKKSAKKVDFQLVGEETEVDKTVIELITDPLVHLIRNSMDHGLEGPEERVAAGKSEIGIVRLSASHEEGNVQITITDDGRGLSRERIIAKARERGIIDDDGSQMKDSEVFNMVFLPGFSTADQITDVSGRGVGMDVVRQNLNKINGKIDIHSKFGKGTSIVLRIPLTMAIIEGMLIRTGKSRYIVPLLSIRESFQPRAEQITVSPDGQELVRVREHLLPVIRLHELHNIRADYTNLDQGILIVLETKDSNFCLFVDEMLGQQQTVIKGLSNYITKVGNAGGGVSGCTIMGDGEVCLILDVQNLGEISQVN